jgi:hypothetical protein
MDGRLFGLTTAHGLRNTPSSYLSSLEREAMYDSEGEETQFMAKGEGICNVPPPAMLIAASSSSGDGAPKQRQPRGGGGARRVDWALVDLPEEEILPNFLSSPDDDPDDMLSD